MAWTWRYRPTETEGAETESPSFSNQGDAETWLGEAWRDLLAQGVTEVTLYDGEILDYTMPLTAE
jgi:hypothetical protein